MASVPIRIMVAAAIVCAAAGCGRPAPTPEKASPAQPGPSRLLAGGRYDITMPDRIKRGKPFEITSLTVSLEVRNNTETPVVPRCVLWYGTQVAPIDTGDEPLEPEATVWLTGRAEFLRPLDDYESGDAGCFTRPRRSTQRDIERERQAMTVGRATVVPDLVGLRLDSRLPNFRRGLDIRIERESTPCSRRRLMKMSRYVNPFGRPPCGDPVVAGQDPRAGREARVGDEIRVTVIASADRGGLDGVRRRWRSRPLL